MRILSAFVSKLAALKTDMQLRRRPADCNAKTLHIATPDISAGGKGRPNGIQKFVDKVRLSVCEGLLNGVLRWSHLPDACVAETAGRQRMNSFHVTNFLQ